MLCKFHSAGPPIRVKDLLIPGFWVRFKILGIFALTDEAPNSIREQLVTLIIAMPPQQQWAHLACQAVIVVNGVHVSVRWSMPFPHCCLQSTIWHPETQTKGVWRDLLNYF